MNNAHAMLQLIINGNGIAALPSFLVKHEIAAGTLVRVLPEQKSKPLGVYAVWPSNTPKGGTTHRLISFLKERTATLK